MHEYRASLARDWWRVVMAEDDDQVVESVFAPQLFVAGRKGQPDETIVVRVGGVVAPSLVGGYFRYGKRCSGPLQAVGSVEDPA